MRAAETGGPVLAIDSGSPLLSVAVGLADRVLAEAHEGAERASADLLRLIERVLAEAAVGAAELSGLVALRGPGSFTGLRVGLATALGLHQALRLPATAVPTLEVLGALGPEDGSTAVAVVDALRGEWFAQPFRAGAPLRALGPPRVVTPAELCRLAPAEVIGFGAGAVAELAAAGISTLEPPPLAGVTLRRLDRLELAWDPASLVEPLYLRPPAARAAAPRRA